jgi:site-specific DNA-methyltransferase (adenine-specific)
MNKKTQETMFSSQSAEWETPQDFFDRLNQTHNFTLDPCSTLANTKCPTHYVKAQDGLSQDWGGHKVFVNPPYGREMKRWVKKSFEESQKPNTTVVMLIPARTDTQYWHDYCMKADIIYFVKGRLHFKNKAAADYTGKTKTSPAPFPSAVIVFKGEVKGSPLIGVIKNK